MSSRTSIQQFISNYEPSGAAIGDEWNNQLTGKLYKRTLVSGVVSWFDITPTLTTFIVPRSSITTSSATPSINVSTTDIYGLTAQAVDITSFTTNLTGTPVEGQKLWIYIIGTGARAITWGTSFESSVAILPTTTVSTNRLDVGFVWNSVTSKWRCMATA